MKVSIIIPVYRVEDYIEDCVSSVIGQTHAGLEVILVDDCGGDASIDRAEALLRQTSLEWKTIRHRENRGQAAARNSGGQAATGDFIFFLDSDDMLLPHAIEHLLSLQRLHRADVVEGSMQLFIPEGVNLPSYIPEELVRVNTERLSTNPPEAFWQGDLYISPCCKLIRRDFYLEKQLRFEEGIIYEDESWTLKLALEARRVYLSKEILYTYRMRAGSTTHSFEDGMLTVRSQVKSVGLLHELLSGYGVTMNDAIRKWYWEKVMVCLLCIHRAVELGHGEKLTLYKDILYQCYYPYPRGLTKDRILQMTWVLSSCRLPRHIAFFLSAHAWDCFRRCRR